MCTRPFNIPYTGCVRSTNLESVEISSDKNFEISKIRHLVSCKKEEWKNSHDLYEIEIRRKLENCVFSIATLLPRYEDSFSRALVKLRIKCEKWKDENRVGKMTAISPRFTKYIYTRSACVHLRRVFMERRAHVLRPTIRPARSVSLSQCNPPLKHIVQLFLN